MNSKQKGQQFQPFDALKGFKKALAEQEKNLVEEKPILSEDQERQINDILSQLKINDEIVITIYQNKQILPLQGKIQSIQKQKKWLLIQNQKISFSQLLNIKKSD